MPKLNTLIFIEFVIYEVIIFPATGIKMGNGYGIPKMDRSKKKAISLMKKKMVYGYGIMKTVRSKKKQIFKMEIEMGNGQYIMRTVR